MAMPGIRAGVLASALTPDPRAAAQMSRELGFAGLQFDAISDAIDLTALSGSGRREFRRILAAQDQQLIGLRCDLGARGFALGADVDRLLSRLDRVMECTGAMGSPLLCIDIGALPPAPARARPKSNLTPLQAGLIILPENASVEPSPQERPAPPPDPALLAQVNGAMSELGRHADRYNVMLAFRTELAGFDSLAQVVRQANCQWFGIDLDPVSILQDNWDTDEVFSQLGPLIRHVRGRDALVGADRRTKAAAVGQGNVPWEQLLANLEQADYRGWITIDPVDLPDRLSAAKTGANFLRSVTSTS
jgi:sugar phosphate isomerase/epimerase